jgi:anthranilate synthase component 2
MKILMLDNYDSFTYNLVHIIEKISGKECDVFKNDEISLDQIKHYDKIILSPGPGVPDSAGVLKDLIRTYYQTHSILGVCLGHQAIAEVFGSKLVNLTKVYHGVATPIHVLKTHYIYNNCPNSFMVGRYHSWAVDKNSIGKDLLVTGKDDDGEILSIKHKDYDVNGIQYHPESILSEYGIDIIKNFINN